VSTRDVVLIAAIAVCVLGALYIGLANPFAPKMVDPEGAPRGVPAVCANPECLYEGRFDGSVMRTHWPTTCPKCRKETLYVAQKCPHCLKWTPMPPSDYEGTSIKCIRCGKAIPLYPMQVP